MTTKPRHKLFLEALPKHKNKIQPSALEAGYSESYARSKGKLIYHNALKAEARDIVEQLEGKPLSNIEQKRLMSDIVGLSSDTIMNVLRRIATQEKDLSSALKVITPLAKEHGVILATDDTKTDVTIPMLSLSFGNKDNNIIEGGEGGIQIQEPKE